MNILICDCGHKSDISRVSYHNKWEEDWGGVMIETVCGDCTDDLIAEMNAHKILGGE